MSRRCLNPGCFSSGSNDAGPPEYESDNAVECFNCGAEIDLDDDQFTEGSDSDYYCEDCTPEDEEEEEEEEDALNSAITGQTICPQGIVIDERELTPALKLKLTTAKSAATQGKFS